MTNKLLLLAIILIFGFGCGIMDRVRQATEAESNSAANVNANKTLTDRAVDTAVGSQEVGIPECDQAIDTFASQLNDPDDNFVVKAGKKMAEKTFREQLKQKIEDNKTDKKEVAKFCRDVRDSMVETQNEANSNTAK